MISKMRHLFPESILVRWKYELAGTQQEPLARAARQIVENHTDACVLNGQAYGRRFALCRTSYHPTTISLRDWFTPKRG